MTFDLSERARRSIDQIVDEVASHDPAAAQRLAEELEAALERLGRNPGIGHRREDLTDADVRFLTVRHRYLAVHAGRDPVLIIDVVDGRRDLTLLLRVSPS